MRFALHSRSGRKTHSTDWTPVVEQYLRENGIDYELIDCMRTDIIERLKDFDVLFWHFGNYDHTDMLMARDVLYCARRMGLKVFPDFEESWHFDDKIAEMYTLQSIGAPIPQSNVFYDGEALNEWLAGKPDFPQVAKLRTGSGSHNVKLLKNEYQLRRYASRMWGKGFSPAPSLMYKASSNIRSAHDWSTVVARAKRIPEFLRTRAGGKRFPDEKGYVYLQEFIPNDGYDMKVVVVGDKLTGVVRPVRSHDFRASGGGTLIYDRKYFTDSIIESAFKTSDTLGLQCMGYDYVVDSRNDKGLIVEMSYGFSHIAQLDAGGYFDRQGNWHDEPLNPPVEIIKNILETKN